MRYLRLLMLPLCLWLGGWLGSAPLMGQESTVQVYRSPNPKTDLGIPVDSMRFLNVRSLAALGADLSGGIMTATTSRSGKITLKVYSYDPGRYDGKGSLLYGCYSVGGTGDTYVEQTWEETFRSKSLTIRVQSNDIKKLTKNAKLYFPTTCQWTFLPVQMLEFLGDPTDYYGSSLSAECQKYMVDLLQPVIIEATLEQASVKKFKIPGIGEINASELIKPFIASQDIKRMFAKPLEYPNYTIVAAHRGYWKDAPENSFAAYDATIAAGADMVELDTRLTSDNVLVAFHDICLDRLTTGSGIFRNQTWAQIRSLHLKNRYGQPTNDHPISIEEALLHMKGKILVNLDLKDRGEKDVLYKYAFREAIKIAYRTGTLSQLVIKGKLPLVDLETELRNVSTELGLAKPLQLTDIIYNPVTFGWDTPNMPAYVKSFVDSRKVPGIELTYKTDYDPILPYVPYALNKNVRVGTYTFWPEECAGVISEDNFWTSGSCDIFYRQYAYQGDYGYAAASTSGSSGGGSSGDGSSGGSSGDGGSGGTLSPTASKAPKPLPLDDARGDWDWVFKYGANFIITDRPTLMIEYLKAAGKRDKRTPIITEVPNPDMQKITVITGGTIDEETDLEALPSGVVTGTQTVPFKGIIRRISDYRKVDFFTPDTRQVEVNCNLLPSRNDPNADVSLTNGKYREDCEALKKNTQPCDCNAIYGGSDAASVRQFPLHTLPEWSQLYPGYDIYINANWFDVKSTYPSIYEPSARQAVAKAMYRMPCTDVFGYWQSNSSTTPLSKAPDPTDPDHTNLDAFVVTQTGEVVLVPTQNTPQYYDGQGEEARMAVGGYILAQNGQVRNPMPEGSSATNPKKKTAIGMNGQEMFVLTIQTQLTPKELADFMVSYLGCKDVFMFDGGGSATMLSTTGVSPNPVGGNAGDQVGPGIMAGSFPEDKNVQNQRVFRPIPNFLAIKVKAGAE